jgi:recombination protein RecT
MTEPNRPATDQRALAVRKQADSVRAVLGSPAMQDQLRAALPKHITVDRLVRVTMTSLQQTPKLLDCDRTSLYGAIMTCAQLGLEPVLGRAYLVPFKDKVQFIVGYKGLIDLAVNSGEVTKIFANVVYQHDDFDYAYGINERLEHYPFQGPPAERGEITHAYAIAWFKRGGPPHFEVMLRHEVDAIRDRSQGWLAYKAGKIRESPWDQPPRGDYPQMARKTAIRRLSNYLPLSVQKAFAVSDSYDTGRPARLDAHGDLEVDQQPLQLSNGSPEPAAVSTLDAFAADGEETAQDAPGGPIAPEAAGRPAQPELASQGQPGGPNAPPWTTLSAAQLAEINRHLAAGPLLSEPALAKALELDESLPMKHWPADVHARALLYLSTLRQQGKRGGKAPAQGSLPG